MSAIQNQVIEKNIEGQKRRALDNDVSTVENRFYDSILTQMDIMVVPGFEMAVRSITGSSEHGSNNEVLYLDRRDFFGNAGNNPLMSASSQLDLNTNQDGIVDIRNEENFEHDDFSALRSNYDQRAQVHHMVTGHNAPHNNIPE